MKVLLTSLTPLLILLLADLIACQRRANHGEPCNRLTRCDSRASLTCKKGICECIMSETMTFDSRYGRCSVLPGEKCVYTTVETDNRAEGRSWKEEIPCIPSAQCQEGFCTCFPGFYETATSTCEPKKDHREDCDTENACRDDKFLVCGSDKHCDCNSTISTYDFQRQLCVRRPGADCGDFPQCVANAYCRNPTDYSRHPLPGEPAVCECEDGYFANSHGACERKRGFGEGCENDIQCKTEDYSRLICGANGRCGCNVALSFYDPDSSMCRRLAGVSCADFPFCVENSECGRLREYSLDTTEEPTCDCIPGYFISKNGTCELQRMYGQSCEADNNCKKGLTCNLDNGLCQCDVTKFVYDRVKAKCVSLANSPCQETEDCITNSECLWGLNEIRKQCLCRQGYAPSSNGSCLASHDSWCSDDWTYACNHEQGLVCKEGKCACKFTEFQSFNGLNVQKCVSQVNGPCDDAIPCIANSACLATEGEVIRRCQCKKGFVEVDGSCQFSIGQSCNYSSEITECDAVAPLYCIEGICQCSALQVYDHTLMKCRGLVGSTCSALSENEEGKTPNNFCIQGGECVKRRFSFKGPGVCKCQRGWKATKDRKCLKTLTEEHILQFNTNASAISSI